jgi:hypothetical protein
VPWTAPREVGLTPLHPDHPRSIVAAVAATGKVSRIGPSTLSESGTRSRAEGDRRSEVKRAAASKPIQPPEG